MYYLLLILLSHSSNLSFGAEKSAQVLEFDESLVEGLDKNRKASATLTSRNTEAETLRHLYETKPVSPTEVNEALTNLGVQQ